MAVSSAPTTAIDNRQTDRAGGEDADTTTEAPAEDTHQTGPPPVPRTATGPSGADPIEGASVNRKGQPRQSPTDVDGAVRQTRRGSKRPPRRPEPHVTAAGSAGAATLDPADELEIRLARVVFWEGSYSRRGIDLQRHFDPEPLRVTDLDLLAFDLTPQLARTKTIGEAKTGTSRNAPKPLDRAIWLAGLARLVDADFAELVTALPPSARVKDTAASLGVRANSLDDLAQREHRAGIQQVADFGAHGPTAFWRTKETHQWSQHDPALERAFWFLRSEVWFLDPWSATKRTIGLLRLLAPSWTAGVDDTDAAGLRWLYAEAISVLTLNLVTLTGHAVTNNPGAWNEIVRDRLAEGAVPMHQMRALSNAVDRFVAKLLGELNAPAQLHAEAMGAFLPQPPDWASGLVELTSRLASLRGIAGLPRHVDLVIHERVVHRRHVSPLALAHLRAGDDAELAHARRLLAAFLRQVCSPPEAIDRALTAATTTAPSY